MNGTDGISSTTTIPTGSVASPGSGEVRMEELSELVERLHRAQERTTVDDVAETLGVTPEAVASTLRAMRSERVPPISVPVRAQRRTPRWLRLSAAAATFLFVGSLFFAIGHESGISKGRRNALGGASASRSIGDVSSEGDLAAQLRSALPAGFTLKVGDVAYTGSPGNVYSDEAALEPLIYELIVRESGPAPVAGVQVRASLDEFRRISIGDTTVHGVVDWRPISVEGGGKRFAGQWPRQVRESSGSSALSSALAEARHDAATVAANRISEWAAEPGR